MARCFILTLLTALAGVWTAGAQPTYSREVCHRPNDIAPFALMSYEDARVQGRSILAAIQLGVMPPWKPVPGHGDFQNNLSLSDEQRQTILDWLDAEMPEGDPDDLPAPVVYASEWRLGQPDQIVSMPVAYAPVAREDRPDRYRCFVLPDAVDQDRWVRAVDIVPGVRSVVHHVILYLTDDAAQIKRARELEEEDSDRCYDCWGGPRITPGAGPGLLKAAGGMLGAWVPGMNPAELPADIGVLVPKGAAPHMHQLGHQIRADLVQPDGIEVPLIKIDDWDFHWQGFCFYQKPVPMPYRSKIKASCVFDNTTDRTIRWGESTEDEMCLVFVSFIAQGGIAPLLGSPQ